VQQFCDMRGLEQVLYDLRDDPGIVHDTMSVLTEGYEGLIRQYAEAGLLDLNNNGIYHSSGGVGYTDEFSAGQNNTKKVLPCHMWASAESQEFALFHRYARILCHAL